MIPIELWYGNFGEILKGYKASPFVMFMKTVLFVNLIGLVPKKLVTFLCKYNKNKHIQSCNYCPLVKYLCLGIDCHAVILKQIKYEKK